MVKLLTIKEHLIEDFVCKFCTLPAEDPQLLDCGCLFCKECILNHLKLSFKNNKCPKCLLCLNKEKIKPAPQLLIRILKRIKKISDLEYTTKYKFRSEVVTLDDKEDQVISVLDSD